MSNDPTGMQDRCRQLNAEIDGVVQSHVSTWPRNVEWPAWAGGAVLTDAGFVLHLQVFDLAEPAEISFDTQGPMPVRDIIQQLVAVVGQAQIISFAVTAQP